METGGYHIRKSRGGDREGIAGLGHPPPVADLLAPSPGRRLAWLLSGTRAVTLVAAGAPRAPLLGTLQFLRSRRQRGTWMFGHWRVAAARRREGIGRALLETGVRMLPQARSLYSYVESGNDASMAAHERLGFTAGGTLRGRATLGALSTIGAPTPSLRLEEVGRRDRDALFHLYGRATGRLWLDLFPGLGPRNFLATGRGWLRIVSVAVARQAKAGPAVGFVTWEGARPTFYAEPDACDPALLARMALQLLARGAGRETVVDLRGLPASFAGRPGPIEMRFLMGRPELPAPPGRFSGPDGRDGPPPLPSPPCAPR